MAKKTARAPAPGSSMDPAAIVVAAAVLVAFYPALSGGFVWDDVDYLRNNPVVHAAFPAVLGRLARTVVAGNYHPLTMASLLLDRLWYGTGAFGFHLTSVLLHAANGALVGFVLLALGARRLAAWAGALLWAVHPLRVESVAWVSARKDVLYTLFFLLALLAYLRHAKKDAGAGKTYALSLALFVGSALSKATAVCFVPVILLTDWYVGRLPTARALIEKIPFATLALAVGIVALAAQKTAGAIPVAHDHGLLGRLALAGYGLTFYVAKSLSPWSLSAFYPYPATPSGGLPLVVVLAAVASAAVLIALVGMRERARLAAYAAGFYVATLALVLQVIPVGGAVAADRYSYLPSVAFGLVIAAVLTVIPYPRTMACVVLAAALALGAGAAARCRVWHDGLTLWNDVLAKYPDVALAHQNRGVARAAARDNMGAIADYDAAIAAAPGFADAWANRGDSKAELGRLDDAIADLREAIRLNPNRATYRFNLGLTLGDKGRWNEALASLNEAIRLNPEFAEAYLNRGLALEQMGRAAEGAPDIRRAQTLGYPVGPEILRRFP